MRGRAEGRAVSRGAALGLAGALLLAAALVPGGAAPAPAPAAPHVEPAPHRGYRERLPGTRVGFDLAAIPGGTFVRGEGRTPPEGPAHPVRVRAFWMATTEVTWDLYDLFRKGGPGAQVGNEIALAKDADAITRPTPPYPDEYRGFGRAGHPAVGVSHHAAMEFCRWLSMKTGKTYRLPTEAEWEWACRAGTATAYHFGDRPGRLGEYAWFAGNAGERTHPVGRKKPNPWGLYDVYGNVAEWCLDGYRPFRAGKLTLSPVVLPGAERFPHVVRGGSWADDARGCRSAARRASRSGWNRLDPGKSLWWLWNADFVGFRVVRAVQEQKELRGLRSRVTSRSPCGEAVPVRFVAGGIE